MFRIQFQLFDGWDLFLNFCFAVYIVFFFKYLFLCAIGELILFCNSI